MSQEPVRDTYRQDLPDAALQAEDIRRLRFGVTLRGYAMDQVDDVLARLGQEIAERDELIARLGGGPSRTAAAATDPDEPTALEATGPDAREVLR